MNPRLEKISKEMSYALRHAPGEYGLSLDKDGFVPVESLIDALNRNRQSRDSVSLEDLQTVIGTSKKQRHEIVGNRIRALYGHSIPKRLEMTIAEPPDSLFHGTSRDAVDAIFRDGLRPMNRQYVHLSSDAKTAIEVGKRHDAQPVLLVVDAKAASINGVVFYIGNDTIWLSDYVPAAYISRA